MAKIIDKIVSKENLLWAWNKVNNAYCVGDIWFDTLELAYYEANLDCELDEIACEICSGNYELQPIEPVPFPKKPGKDKDGNKELRIRQAFYISVRDQVTWMAVVNIIGPDLDYRMPAWSFGNRLHRSVWYDPELRIGWYRNSNKNFFRTWKQSWPLFRHSIGLTIKMMTHNKERDNKEQEMLDNNNIILPSELKLQYLAEDYWPNGKWKDLYWAGIDLEKFYPNVNLEAVKHQILDTTKLTYDIEFVNLLSSLFAFRIRIDNDWQDRDLESIGLDKQDVEFTGIPTGLFVAGFLANVAMLKIDIRVNNELKANKNIAVFRYVDDHVILGYKPEDILDWVLFYRDSLKESGIGVSFNSRKTEPEAFGLELDKYSDSITLKERESLIDIIKKECILDPEYPVPLMTQTLAKVSNIADSDIDFLTETEEKQLLADLEHLLLTDFPDHELRCDTRVSFASNMLARIMSNKRSDYTSIYYQRRKLYSEISRLCKENKTINQDQLNSLYTFNNSEISKSPSSIKKNIPANIFAIQKEIKSLNENIENDLLMQKMHIFKLLLKSVKENHDKVKLWRRIIDYGYNTQITNKTIKGVFFAISEIVKQGTAHKLSEQYLYSLFVLVLSDRMMRAISIISNAEYISRSRQKAETFLNACIDPKFVNIMLKKNNMSSMIYYQRSFNIYKASVGCAHLIMGNTQKTLLKNANILNWNDNPKQWFKNNYMDVNSFMSLLLFRANSKFKVETSDNWELFKSKITFDEVLPSCKLYDKSNDPHFINLYEWMEWYNNNPDSFDLRLSEWMAIRIIKKCVELDDSATIFPDESCGVVISPSRYLIPKEWVSETFVIDTQGAIFDDIKISPTALDDSATYNPYLPSAIIQSYQNSSCFHKLYSYAVLLSQLLNRDFKFPWIWRLNNNNVLYPKFIAPRGSHIAISSFTSAVISSCLSSRSRESFHMQYIYEEYQDISRDWDRDPPVIKDTISLVKALNVIESHLRCNIISIRNNQYRQLTPISMAEVTNSNNPFELE